MRRSRNCFLKCALARLACAGALFAAAPARSASLVYSTYLGGTQSDRVLGVAMDAAGNAYLCGQTFSSDFPGGIPNPQSQEAFIAKLSPDGASRLWTTMLGGSDLDSCLDLAVDAAGQVYLTGITQSQDFPGTANAILPSFVGPFGERVFMAKLAANGDLLYSTSLGLGDFSRIALDGSFNAYVLAHRQVSGPGDPCGSAVAKIDPTLTGPAGQQYLKCLPAGAQDIAVDPGGIAFVAGTVGSGVAPPTTAGAFQETCSATAGGSTFVVRLGADGSSIERGTCLSAPCPAEGKLPGHVSVAAIALDPADNVYLAGETTCSDFPITANAFDSTYNGPFSLVPLMDGDVYLARFDPTLSSLLYSSFLGGDWMDHPQDVTVDDFGTAYVVGQAQSADFPASSTPQLGTCPAHFFAQVDTALAGQNSLSYSTCIEGAFPSAVRVGGAGIDAILAGEAMAGLPITLGAYQPALKGQDDGFAMKLQVHSPSQVVSSLQGYFMKLQIAGKLPPGLGTAMSMELDRLRAALDSADSGSARHWLEVVTRQASPLIRRGALSPAESRPILDVLDAEERYLASLPGSPPDGGTR